VTGDHGDRVRVEGSRPVRVRCRRGGADRVGRVVTGRRRGLSATMSMMLAGPDARRDGGGRRHGHGKLGGQPPLSRRPDAVNPWIAPAMHRRCHDAELLGIVVGAIRGHRHRLRVSGQRRTRCPYVVTRPRAASADRSPRGTRPDFDRCAAPRLDSYSSPDARRGDREPRTGSSCSCSTHHVVGYGVPERRCALSPVRSVGAS